MFHKKEAEMYHQFVQTDLEEQQRMYHHLYKLLHCVESLAMKSYPKHDRDSELDHHFSELLIEIRPDDVIYGEDDENNLH